MAGAVDELWRNGITAHLLALHDAARLDLRIRHIPSGLTPDEAAEIRHPGHDLYEALFEPARRVAWRCPVQKRPSARAGAVHEPKVLEVANRRLVTIDIERPPRMPSGWRPERWLVLDLRLAAQEQHQGFHLDCPHCGRTHLFEVKDLRKQKGSPMADHGEAQPSTPPSGYPPAEEVAFAEIWGPYSNLADELTKEAPEIYLYLTPHRKQLLEAALTDHPGAPVYPSLLAGPAMRIIDPTGQTRLQHAISPHNEDQRIWEK